MLKVGIRADGGKNVGMGHIMRCLSLAKAFRENGHKVYFFSKLDAGIEKVSSENFEVIKLPSVERETEVFFYGSTATLVDEAKKIITLYDQYQIDIVLIDTYNVSEEYFLTLKKHVGKLAYIDDVNKFSYPVDIVINGNITGEYMGYNKYDEKQVLLLGPQYNMIRDEFSSLPAKIVRKNVEEIMITTGGSDPYNITGKLLNILLHKKDFKDLRINILVGSGFSNCEELVKLSQRYERVSLYANSTIANDVTGIVFSEVRDLMLRSDLAISAGGSTLYEFAACGTPVLAFILADNQEFLVEKMDELGYVKSLGWYNQIEEQNIIASLVAILNDYYMRKEMGSKGQALVDGRGTERIVHEILKNWIVT